MVQIREDGKFDMNLGDPNGSYDKKIQLEENIISTNTNNELGTGTVVSDVQPCMYFFVVNL
jgi:hypothetical protein